MSRIEKGMLVQQEEVEPLALQHLIDFGPGYFNPLLGCDDAETFVNLEAALQFLHQLLDKDAIDCEGRRGLALFVQTIWTACQYEAHRRAVG